MRVAIVTEGGVEAGFGHVVRCSSLCDAFVCRGIEPEFIVQGDSSVVPLLEGKRVCFVDWLRQPELLWHYLNGEEVVILDAISVTRELSLEIGRHCRLPVYIDDFNDYSYERGIAVDWTIFAETYHRNRNECNLFGTHYAALRKEFWPEPIRLTSNRVDRILLTMGGSDIRGLTPGILQKLVSDYPDAVIMVIVGRGFTNIPAILAQARGNVQLIYYPDAEQIKDVMASVDLAVSAGGQTLYELARLRVPTIAVAVADNQMYDIDGWLRAGFIEYAGAWGDRELPDEVAAAVFRLLDPKERERRAWVGGEFMDGRGAERIIDAVMSIYFAGSADVGGCPVC